jgi:hypothetical protein
MDRNGSLETVVPSKANGCDVEYPVAAFTVRRVMDPEETPGLTFGTLMFGMFLISASVRLKVAGNVKIWPAARGPVGNEELLAVKRGFVRTRPVIAVIAILALQLTFICLEVPNATSPKSIGEVQFSGRLTGLPRHIT